MNCYFCFIQFENEFQSIFQSSDTQQKLGLCTGFSKIKTGFSSTRRYKMRFKNEGLISF